MNQQEIDYSKIMALGFKEKLIDDTVYKRRYGYDYYYIHKKMCKNIRIEWSKSERTCDLVRYSGINIKGRLPIRDLDHLIEVIDFFKGDVITKKVTFKKGVTKFEGVKDIFEIKA